MYYMCSLNQRDKQRLTFNPHCLTDHKPCCRVTFVQTRVAFFLSTSGTECGGTACATTIVIPATVTEAGSYQVLGQPGFYSNLLFQRQPRLRRLTQECFSTEKTALSDSHKELDRLMPLLTTHMTTQEQSRKQHASYRMMIPFLECSKS